MSVAPRKSGFSPMSAPRYEILKKRTRAAGDMRGWSLHKRSSTESVCYVVIASKLAKQGENARSKLLAGHRLGWEIDSYTHSPNS